MSKSNENISNAVHDLNSFNSSDISNHFDLDAKEIVSTTYTHIKKVTPKSIQISASGGPLNTGGGCIPTRESTR